jgi:hypothetical protein
MPTVPTTFVPQVAPQGGGAIGDFAAPGIQPAENLAGPQVARFGQQLTQTGMAAYRLGSAIQDGIDEAKTKEADVAAGRAMQAVSDKYMAMIGKDAEVNYGAMQDELSQAGQSAMGMLDNDVQRRMLSPILARNMGIFESRMAQHRVQQLRVYQTNESKARSDMYVDASVSAFGQIGRDDAEANKVMAIQFEANKGIALEEARKAARLVGIPDGSAQMKLIERDVNDRIASGIVDQLVASKEYGKAEEYVSGQADAIGAPMRETLSGRIESNRKAVVIEELTANITAFGRPEAKSDPGTYPVSEDAEAKPPQTLREALLVADSIEDPLTRKAVRANLESNYARRDALVEAEYQKLNEDIANVFAVEGRVPPAMLAQLEPKDREKWLTLTTEKDEQYEMMLNADNPGRLTKQYVVDAFKNRKISPATYTKLMSELNKPDAPQRLFEATVDANMLNTTLYDNGFADLVNPAKSNAVATERKIRLQNAVSLRVEAEQNKLGRKMSDKEKQGIIDRAIIEMGTSVQEGAGWFGFDTTEELPVSMMTQRQLAGVTNRFLQIGDTKIPGGVYEAIYADLASTGRVPTAKQVLEYYERTRNQE